MVSPNVSLAAEVMDEDEINRKLFEIADNYSINEPLSKEDADFVKKYATPVNTQGEVSTAGTKTKKISGSKTSNGIKANLVGNITATLGIINNSFGGNIRTNIL